MNLTAAPRLEFVQLLQAHPKQAGELVHRAFMESYDPRARADLAIRAPHLTGLELQGLAYDTVDTDRLVLHVVYDANWGGTPVLMDGIKCTIDGPIFAGLRASLEGLSQTAA